MTEQSTGRGTGVADLLVVGAGLIGTSVGMALHGAADVLLSDIASERAGRAVERGAGRLWDGREPARMVLLAVPPRSVASVYERLARLNVSQTFTHVSSMQSSVQNDLERLGAGVSDAVCGGHPLAGRERSGPEAATADLFAGRPWVVCPSPTTRPDAVEAVRRLAVACGAEPVVMTAQEHDRAVALVSHLPQVVASALAAQLVREPTQARVQLAGPGLQDTTRIAASDPALWREILHGNAAHVAPLVRALAADLTAVADALETVDPPSTAAAPAVEIVEDLLRRGGAGRRLVPVKRGKHEPDFASVEVSAPDRPGQLAGILLSAAQADINVEDVRVEHLPGRSRGVISLLVRASSVDAARQALAESGWELVTPL